MSNVNLKRKRMIIFVLGIAIALLALCFAILHLWSRISLDIYDQNYLTDPAGGCLMSDRPSEIEDLGYLIFPANTSSIHIMSDKSAIDICYIMLSFSLSSADLTDFLRDNAIDLVSSTFSDSGFWHGADLAKWPLVKGSRYFHGSSTKILRNIKVVYERAMIYAVIIVGS